ncbi:precorrin-6y C5,15-methyltransferase (decarboxylating) subunit CbiE [Conexibacter sp. CPCC 206217]|uniref:precorrin-6y C5,15-methyltransferase (decarboxylating) subunit CbiE n=1 Tax=Conexibacter sp. CPCC 206217 TaxID=3064574 RepID=UPI002716DF8A|nr:precorrin-6y C5,15-methyltransferase (decarboxylating) subunit CbiE [Conexibacter sp. CPCC 206217]MDO8213628.1 precorrin-6y C5,15-methyltransferase (decarboxylating) subunit CbiE [Conexibacter sp. CPCC 206217]
MTAQLTVVGIGADGYDGLGATARQALTEAPLVVGSTRQLELLPPAATAPDARRLPWPSPLERLLDELVTGRHGDAVVLASGDPMLHGIGASLARRIAAAGGAPAATDPAPAPAATLRAIPHPSAFALACARLGWPAADTELLSTVARAPQLVARSLQPGRRLVVYATGSDGAAQVARVLVERGWGPSRFVVLEQLGGPRERLIEATAAGWRERCADPLHAIAIETRAAPGTRALATTPGLPDDAFDHDGQLTKRHVRAVTLAALAPLPGELLWDVGAGNGSIAIEWLRAVVGTRAVAFEANADRAVRIAANASTLGVPELRVVHGRAPEVLARELNGALDASRGASDADRGASDADRGAPDADRGTPDADRGTPDADRGTPGAARGTPDADRGVPDADRGVPDAARPDAVFIGGGLTAPGLLDAAWAALRPGGRIVVNAVTLESQARLLEARAAHGGSLTQVAIAHAEPVGSFSGWRQQMPVVQWEARKQEEPEA